MRFCLANCSRFKNAALWRLRVIGFFSVALFALGCEPSTQTNRSSEALAFVDGGDSVVVVEVPAQKLQQLIDVFDAWQIEPTASGYLVTLSVPPWSWEEFVRHWKDFIQSPRDYARENRIRDVIKWATLIDYEDSDCDSKGYLSVEGSIHCFADLERKHPLFVETFDVGDSWRKSQNDGGYDILAYRFTDERVQIEKPKLLLVSSMHPREVATSEMLVRLAKDLVGNSAWRELLATREVWLLPHANPDGHKLAELGQFWRKTWSWQGICRGVDINRNFDWHWQEGRLTGWFAGLNSCTSTYGGSEPGSESETQALMALTRRVFPESAGDALLAPGMIIDIHSAERLVTYPWLYTKDAAPHRVELAAIGQQLAELLQYPLVHPYRNTVAGSFIDWAYGTTQVPTFAIELEGEFFERPERLDVLYNKLKPALIFATEILN